MPRYQLFAARDGDTFSDEMSLPDLHAAKNWASEKLMEEFDLGHMHGSQYDELVAETDGVRLEVRPRDQVDHIVMDKISR